MNGDEVSQAPLSEQPAQSAGDTRALGRTLIDEFGGGWAKGNLEQMMSVFSADAVFIETPFSEPQRGQANVRRFWAEVPLHQSEVSFSSGEIYAAGPWFSTEFKCVFRRKRTGEWVDARGAIFCETAAGKISEMRMYWHRWNGGRETSKP